MLQGYLQIQDGGKNKMAVNPSLKTRDVYEWNCRYLEMLSLLQHLNFAKKRNAVCLFSGVVWLSTAD